MVAENCFVKKSKQNSFTGYQLQTQATSVISNTNVNKIETTESVFPTEVTHISPSTSSTPTSGINMPLKV